MRLAMIYDEPVHRDGETLRMHRRYGVYVDALAPHFSSLLLAAPLAPPGVVPQLQHHLGAGNAGLLELPYFARWTGSAGAVARVAPALWRRRAEWDAVYLRVPSPLAPPVYALARALGRPICLHVVGDLLAQMADYPPPLQSLARSSARLYERLTRLMARRALTVTQGAALARRYGSEPNPAVSIIESTVSAGSAESEAPPSYARGEQGPLRVLFVGAVLEKKGLRQLLEALAALRSELEVDLVVVGRGPALAQMRQLAENLHLGERVHFRGGVDSGAELRDAYAAADVFAVPSLAEGVPRVLFEAMAAGLPVVTTSAGGIGEVIADGVDGLVVEPGSPAALAAAIGRLGRDPELRARLWRGGRETVRRFTCEAHADELAARLRAWPSARRRPARLLPARRSAGEPQRGRWRW